jgi:hypothetical protein
MKQLSSITDDEVKNFFSHHIGYVNAASLQEVSKKLFNHKLEDNEFELDGMRTLASRLVEKYRRSKILFIMRRNGMYFVPDCMDDVRYFKHMITTIEKGMKNSYEFLQNFVADKKYEDLLLKVTN